MSFLEEVQAQRQHQGPVCGVRRWLASQSTVTDTDLREAAAAVSAAAAWRVMQGRGFTSQRSVVERHIKGECSCPTS